MSRMLVTGGAGFIGSHLVDRLLENGNDVTVVDDMSSGDLSNLKINLKNQRLLVHKTDFADSRFLRSSLPKIETVVHLAALTSVPYSILHPEPVYRVNVAGTLALLRACVKHSVRRFVLASSAAVYGNHKPPLSERLPTDPLSPYAASKVSAEALVRAFYSSYGLESVILRFMNVYGPRSFGANEGVIPKFLRAIKENETLAIYGDGNQTRDFVHVSDVVDSIVSAIGTNASCADAFNVGTGRPTTVNELVRLLQDLLPSRNLRIESRPEVKGEVKHSYADVSKAAEVLRFKPKVELKRGLDELLRRERFL